MGALAALTKWIPEDDLLLKNAVEAGASLESLAKGAVHFSRRYTITELQDRWRSLLYDLDTSAEASARIIEIEIELSVTNAPKANRLTGSKVKEIPGKRKGGSVKSHFYAMRKRVCSEPCHSANFGLLEPSSLIPPGNGVGYRHVKPQIGDAVSNCVTAKNFEFQEPSPNHYDHLEIAYDSAQDILHDIAMLGSAAVDASVDAADRFHTDSIDDDFPDGIADNDCLFQYTESNIPSVDKLEADNAHQAFHHDFVRSDMPQPAVECLSSSNLYQNLHETGLPQTLPESNIYGHDGVKTESLPDFDLTINSHEQLCSGFEGKDDLSLQVPEHGDSFDRLRCSSSQVGITAWETIDGISPPPIGIDGHFGDNQGANSVLDFHDITEMHSPETELQDRIPDGALDSSRIVVENEYMGVSSSYMNFADDEFLLINIDEDIADRSSLNGINSILLSSPSDAQQDNACISSGPDVKEAADTCPIVNDAACQGDLNDLLEEICPANDDDDSVCVAGGNEPSTSVRISHNTESTEVFMFCAFNTEDTEIPCNDDVYLPCHSLPSSLSDAEHSHLEKHASISSGEFLLDDGRLIAQPYASSVKTGFSNIGLMESSDGCRTETRSNENNSRAAASRCAGVALGEPNSCTSINACLYPSAQSAQKQENTAKNLGKHGSLNLFLCKPTQVSDLAICNANHYKEEANMHETLQGCIQYEEQSHDEMTIGDMEKSMSKSDQDDHFSDSDCDVPNFSDIEAMILDMDLDPQDQDSSLFTKEVSRYQCGHTKRDIIRLEQGAHSYLQRAMSFHKAFAVLYGRHLKHYIKSPKVSLGRATDDLKVDIDLSREGRSKKISRRQAIIKMEKDGSFFLTNVGKGSIFINSKEVPTEKMTKLTSGCLIEIRGMRLIFEVNRNAVRHFLNKLEGKQEENLKFDWTHDQNHQIS